MNIFEYHLTEIKEVILSKKNNLNLNEINDFKGVSLEVPPDQFNYDLSCNIAMILGKKNKIRPKELALKLKVIFLEKISNFSLIEIAGPGFMNIKLSNSALLNNINSIFKNKKFYGSVKDNKTYNIEFVSANPTGPMHVGHCRGAIYGDVLANLLKFNGNKVTKEYYVNDYGEQIKFFVESVYFRIQEIKYNKKFPEQENLYPGLYIKDIASKIIHENKDFTFNDFTKNFEFLKKESLKKSMELIKKDLKNLGITHDNFFSETEIVNKDLVTKAIKILKEKRFVEEGFLQPPKGETNDNWKKMKRLIFKSTLFGDDADRALQKNDGSWTYFANDVAYHMNKVSRNYENLVNVLGADHTGYTKRIKAAVSALSDKKVKIKCVVCQLVKLFKNGSPFKMSKRAGEFISAQDLLNEVEKDQIRFMMLNRSNDVELDFDFNKVLEKSKDNHVFYVQYCYARIKSLTRILNLNLNDPINFDNEKFNLNHFDIKILRKIYNWPKVLESASKYYEPHRITFYLYDLATLFHSYWSRGNKEDQYKFVINNKIKSLNTFAVIKLLSIVIENGMKILNVSLPEKM